MKNYETVFILNPALSEEQVENAVDKYEKYLKSNGAKIVSKEILNNSANKNGVKPSSMIGLSQPISIPNHKIPKK